MGFQQGLSGLDAAAKGLDVVGNNVANANTAGFKAARALFADVYANSLYSGSDNAIGIGTQVQAVQQQFTQGNISVTNNPLDLAVNGRGFFRLSENGTISYSRNGQFHLDQAGYLVDAAGRRLTGYAADANGNIVPAAPVELQLLTGDQPPRASSRFGAVLNLDSRATRPVTQTQGTVTGTAGPIAFPLTLTAGVNDTLDLVLNGIAGTATIAAGTYATAAELAAAVESAINAVPAFASAGYRASVAANANVLTLRSALHGHGSSIAVSGGSAVTDLGFASTSTSLGSDHFDPANPASFTSSTSGTLYDSLGNPHVLTLYFVKTDAVNGWRLYATLDGTSPAHVDLGAGAGQPIALGFDAAGALTTPMPLAASLDLAAAAAQLGRTNGAATPLALALDFSGTTQFGSLFGVNSLVQDGYGPGRLSGVNVGADGVILGRYTNGQTRAMGQVVLANFTNPNGLKPLGSNQWSETSDSGLAQIGAPGSASLGVLQSAAVEESNVDLTAELVTMITLQRVYQANAQTIKTQDAVLQTLVNLR
jgi:flagellar hook protein FlgE